MNSTSTSKSISVGGTLKKGERVLLKKGLWLRFSNVVIKRLPELDRGEIARVHLLLEADKSELLEEFETTDYPFERSISNGGSLIIHRHHYDFYCQKSRVNASISMSV